MKLNHVLAALGFRSKPEFYGYAIKSFRLGKDGIARFAQWQQPKCRLTRFDQGSVDELRARHAEWRRSACLEGVNRSIR